MEGHFLECSNCFYEYNELVKPLPEVGVEVSPEDVHYIRRTYHWVSRNGIAFWVPFEELGSSIEHLMNRIAEVMQRAKSC